MSNIKNVIFDMGGVIMNLDYGKSIRAFEDMGYRDFEKMYSGLKMNNVFDDLETGKLSEEAFYRYMQEQGKDFYDKEKVTAAWNAMLLNFRESSLAFLKELAKTHKLFLLSNTNTIHKLAFDNNFRTQTGIPSIDSFFTKAYFSHLVGMRKPNEDIFNFVAADAGILAAETLFIDDIYANIETAARLGFRTYHFREGDMIESLDYTRD